eukprot:2552043-Pleurochrysis_carterae.AAC.1
MHDARSGDHVGNGSLGDGGDGVGGGGSNDSGGGGGGGGGGKRVVATVALAVAVAVVVAFAIEVTTAVRSRGVWDIPQKRARARFKSEKMQPYTSDLAFGGAEAH